MKSRGATANELNETLERIKKKIKERVDPDYIRTFKCRGGCEDTGWVTIETGVPGRAPVVRRCGQCGGQFSRPDSQSRGGSFS